MEGLDQLFELAKNGNSSLINSILLVLIWLNVRSLKRAMIDIEDGHDKRLGALETKSEKHETRLTVLEQK